jgi:hypothetical protein
MVQNILTLCIKDAAVHMQPVYATERENESLAEQPGSPIIN